MRTAALSLLGFAALGIVPHAVWADIPPGPRSGPSGAGVVAGATVVVALLALLFVSRRRRAKAAAAAAAKVQDKA